MENKICQSCGMPLGDPAFYATNKDDSRNEDYCIYCYAGGGFNDEMTMDEMIEQCADIYEMNSPAADEQAREKAIEKMRQVFPTLKRWQKE